MTRNSLVLFAVVRYGSRIPEAVPDKLLPRSPPTHISKWMRRFLWGVRAVGYAVDNIGKQKFSLYCVEQCFFLNVVKHDKVKYQACCDDNVTKPIG
jgi:hypothetical protein